jgi:anti-sigma regulatory factor (Ser/Thr protein kinase)
MMGTRENLRLELEAKVGSVGVARGAVAEFAQEFGMKEPALGDLKTIVSEACSNVVRHAYPGGSGQFEVEACRVDGQLSMVVRDFGEGMQAGVETEESSMRLGLGLISMLSSHFEVSSGSDGTEIRMRLPMSS